MSNEVLVSHNAWLVVAFNESYKTQIRLILYNLFKIHYTQKYEHV